MSFVHRASAAVLLASLATCAGPAPGHQVATVGGVALPVYTYRPPCAPRLVLLVFHGTQRNAGPYRDHAKGLADATCAFVAAPEFDQARFPRDAYQYGGTRGGGKGRTIDLVPALIGWARGQAGAPDLPVVLLGHSAGAQFLGRVAAFVPTGAAGIIIANPSTWVLPSTDTAAPYGFGGTDQQTDTAVRAYLARPITVLLGTADTGSHELATSPGAMAQGPNRHERGLNTFHLAQEVARTNGWPLAWRLSEVPGVGHDATAMFDSKQALEAVRRAVP